MSASNSSAEKQSPPLPSFLARYTCVAILLAIMSVWAKFAFPGDELLPGVDYKLSYKIPLFMTVSYVISLPLLTKFTSRFLSHLDMKELLKESMIVYNVAQVLLNGWMVYKFVDAVLNKGHPFIGDLYTARTGTVYAIWVHYCDKYLEFFDTYFMVLRGKTDQVSFLHVYHHTTIAWAWWAAINLFPTGDSYFGALLNSWIHVMMYSYYALSLLKVSCPWKRFLTMAQLIQFASVVVYTGFAMYLWPAEKSLRHYSAALIQVGEMTSLFVLFYSFYRKSYNKSRKSLKSSESSNDMSIPKDQCEAAVKAIGATTQETIGKAATAAMNAASDANKLAFKGRKLAPVPGKTL